MVLKLFIVKKIGIFMVKIIFGKLIDIRGILVNLINRVYICVYIKLSVLRI